MDDRIIMHMHEGIMQFQLNNILSWDVNKVALKRNQAVFEYKYFSGAFIHWSKQYSKSVFQP